MPIVFPVTKNRIDLTAQAIEQRKADTEFAEQKLIDDKTRLSQGLSLSVKELAGIARNNAPELFNNMGSQQIADMYIKRKPELANQITDFDVNYREKIPKASTDFLPIWLRPRDDLPGNYNPTLKDGFRKAWFNVKAMGVETFAPAAMTISKAYGLMGDVREHDWLNFSEDLRGWSNDKVDEWVKTDTNLQAYLNWEAENPMWGSKLSVDLIVRGFANAAPSLAFMIGTRTIAGAFFKTMFRGSAPFLIKTSTDVASLLAISALEGSSEYNEAMSYLVDEQGQTPQEASPMAMKASILYGLGAGVVEFSQADLLMKLAGSKVSGSSYLLRGFSRKLLNNKLLRGTLAVSATHISESVEEAVQNMQQEVVQSVYRDYGGDWSKWNTNVGHEIVKAFKSDETKEAFASAFYGLAPVTGGAGAIRGIRSFRSSEIDEILPTDVGSKIKSIFKGGKKDETAEEILSKDFVDKTVKDIKANIPGIESTPEEFLTSVVKGIELKPGKEDTYVNKALSDIVDVTGESSIANKLLQFVKIGGEKAINDIIDHPQARVMVPAILTELRNQGLPKDVIDRAMNDKAVFGELLTLFNKKGTVKVEKSEAFEGDLKPVVKFKGLDDAEKTFLSQEIIEETQVAEAIQPKIPTAEEVIEASVKKAEIESAKVQNLKIKEPTIEDKSTIIKDVGVSKPTELKGAESLISTPDKPISKNIQPDEQPKTEISSEFISALEKGGYEYETTNIPKETVKSVLEKQLGDQELGGLKPLAEFLLKNISEERLDTDVFTVKNLSQDGQLQRGTAAQVKIGDDIKKMILLDVKKANISTPIHEMMHVLTSEQYIEDNVFKTEIDRLMDIAKVEVAENSRVYDKYLTKDGREFIAGLYTDMEFQQSLGRIRDPKSKKSILNKLLEAIKTAFGITALKDSVLETAFNQVFNVLSEQVRPEVRKNVISMQVERQAEKNNVADELATPPDEEGDGSKITTADGKRIRLTVEQDKALGMVHDWITAEIGKRNPEVGNRFFTLAGFAGTGKSTILNEVLNMLKANKKVRVRPAVAITAPTHNAVEVASEMISGRADALTLQSLLGMELDEDLANFNPLLPSFRINKERVKINNYNFVIIDEASMINSNLYDYLVRNTSVPVLFLGDSAQLPPVGEIISDVFLDDRITNKIELTEVMRIKGGNPILKIVTNIREGLENWQDSFAHVNMKSDDGSAYFLSEGQFKQGIKKIFSSERYKAERDSRILAYGNPTVEKWNSIAREAVFPGVKAQLIVGETMLADQTVMKGTGENAYKLIQNSAVYKIGSLKEVTTNDGIEVYEVELLSPMGNPIETVNIVKETPDNLDIYVARLSMLMKQARQATGTQKKFNWKVYQEFLTNHLSMSAHKSRVDKPWKENVVNKHISYGYASTVHKAQGRNIREVFVDEVNIDVLPWVAKQRIENPGKFSQRPKRKMTSEEEHNSYIERNKMKYTAFSRSSENLYVLENPRIKQAQDTQINLLDNEVQDVSYPDSNFSPIQDEFIGDNEAISDETGKELSKSIAATTYFSNSLKVRIKKSDYKAILEMANNSLNFEVFKEAITTWAKKNYNFDGEFTKRTESNLKEEYNKNAMNKIHLSMRHGDGGRIHRVAEFESTSSRMNNKWVENVSFKKLAFKKVDKNHLNKGKKNPGWYTKNFYEMDMSRGNTNIKLHYLSFKDAVKKITLKNGDEFWKKTDLSGTWFLNLDYLFNKLYEKDGKELSVFVAAKGGDLSKAIFAEVPNVYKNYNEQQLLGYLKQEIANGNMAEFHANAMIKSIERFVETNPYIYGQVIGKHEALKQIKHNKYLLGNKNGTVAEDFDRLKIDLNDVWTVNELSETSFMILPEDTEVKFNGITKSTIRQYDGHLISGTRLLNSIGNKVGHSNLKEIKTFIRQRSKDGNHYVAFKMMQMSPTPGAEFYSKGNLVASVVIKNGESWFETPDGKQFDMLGTDNEAKQRAGDFTQDGVIHKLNGHSIGIDHIPKQLDGAAFPVTHGELALTGNQESVFFKLVSAYKQHYRAVAKDYLDRFFDFKFDRSTLMSEINTSVEEGDIPTELQKLADIIGPDGKGSEHPNFSKQVLDHITNKVLARGLMKVRRKGQSTQMTYKPDARNEVRQGDVIIGNNRVLIAAVHEAAGFAPSDIIDTSYLNDWLGQNDFDILLSRQPVAKVTGVVLRRISKIRPSEGDVMITTFDDIKNVFDGDFDGDHGFAEILPTFLSDRFKEVMKSDEWKSRDKSVSLSWFNTGLKPSTIANYIQTFEYLNSTLNNSGMIGAITNSKSVLSAINYKGLKIYPDKSNGVAIVPIRNSQRVNMDYISLDISNENLFDEIKANGDFIINDSGIVLDKKDYNELLKVEEKPKVYLRTTSENEWANMLQMAVDDSKFGLLAKIGINRDFLLKRMFQINDGTKNGRISRADHIEVARAIRAYFNYSEIRQNNYNGRTGKLNDIISTSTSIVKRFYDKVGKRFDAEHIATDLDFWLNNPTRPYLSDGAKEMNRKPSPLMMINSVQINDNRTPIEELLTSIQLQHDRMLKGLAENSPFQYTSYGGNPVLSYNKKTLQTAHKRTMLEIDNAYDSMESRIGFKTKDKRIAKEFMDRVADDFYPIFELLAKTDEDSMDYTYSEEMAQLVDKYKDEFDNLLTSQQRILSTIYFLQGTPTLNQRGRTTRRVHILRLLPVDLMESVMLGQYLHRFGDVLADVSTTDLKTANWKYSNFGFDSIETEVKEKTDMCKD